MTQKMVMLGDFYRHYRYAPFKLIKSYPKKVRSSTPSDDYEKNKAYYADVSRRTLRDLVLSNLHYGNPRFITLTYASPQFSNSSAKRDFKTFIQRLRYHLGELGHNENFRYIAVPEQHDSTSTNEERRYSYHFHVVLFDLPYISTTFYSNNWKHGFIKINLIKGSPFGTAFYLTKYLSKQTTHERSQRRYLVSRNIHRPQEVQFNNLPILEFKKAVNYHTFTGSDIRIDYYQTLKPKINEEELKEKKKLITFTYGHK